MTETAHPSAARDELASRAIMEAFKGNAPAAAVFLNLRKLYAQHIIRAARCTVQGDDAGQLAAEQDAATTQRTARALLIGLGVQSDQPVKAAHAAAYLLAEDAMNPAELLSGESSEPRALYVDDESADAYTLSAAPDRVIWSTGSKTAYLFSLSDLRQFCQRTGRAPRPLEL